MGLPGELGPMCFSPFSFCKRISILATRRVACSSLPFGGLLVALVPVQIDACLRRQLPEGTVTRDPPTCQRLGREDCFFSVRAPGVVAYGARGECAQRVAGAAGFRARPGGEACEIALVQQVPEPHSGLSRDDATLPRFDPKKLVFVCVCVCVCWTLCVLYEHIYIYISPSRTVLRRQYGEGASALWRDARLARRLNSWNR